MDYDILIIGGGMVGASLAVGLAPLPLPVGWIQAGGVGAVGSVVENRALGQALKPALAETKNLTVICPATVEDVAFSESAASVTFRRGAKLETLSARLVVAADGGAPPVRNKAGIEARRTDYHAA